MSDGTVINPGCVYTIGHGGRTMDQLISELSNHNVPFVIDVRSAPYSRYQPEFSKDSECSFFRRGIEVLHLLPDGTVWSQDDVIREITGGQDTLFA